MSDIPTIKAVTENLALISRWIETTPVWHCQSQRFKEAISPQAEVFLKLELFQQTGSFKVRGALSTLLRLDKAALQRGVVAASAGNHAVGISYAAKMLGTTAKVIMPEFASLIKMERCKDYGAEVILVDSMATAFDKMHHIAQVEGRTAVHPFEGPYIPLGTGSIGLELQHQIENLEAIIAPVGGGGLCAGIGAVIKQLSPQCQVFGVEPEGANVMYRSLLAGKPVTLDKINTIADSLAVPSAMPYSFSLCQRFLDEVVCVSDAAMAEAMRLLFYEMKLAVEPAAAAPLAALCGPLRERLQGKRVALIVSGTNIDIQRYCLIVHPTDMH